MKYLYAINDFVDCHDFVVSSGLEYLGYNSNLLKIGFFNSHYISKMFSEYVPLFQKIERGVPIRDIAYSIFGVRLNSIVYDDDFILESVKENLKKSPIMFSTDAFDCNWSPFFLKVHSSHDILIFDLDYQNQVYQCLDIYSKQLGPVLIPFYEMQNFKRKTFSIYHFDEFYPDDYIANAIKVLFNMMDQFNDDLVEDEEKFIYLFDKELTRNDIGNPMLLQNSVMLTKLMWMAEDKRLFLAGLMLIEKIKCHNFFEEAYESLQAAHDILINLKNILIRYCITGYRNNENMIKLMKELYHHDRKSIKFIHKALSNDRRGDGFL